MIKKINSIDKQANAAVIYFNVFDKDMTLPPGEYSYFELENKYFIIEDADIYTYKKMEEIIKKYRLKGLKGNQLIPNTLFLTDEDILYENENY